MEFLFIVSIGALMTLLAWMVLLPFREFHAALRVAGSFVSALWEGWFRFFGRLALSDSASAGRRNRFSRMPPEASQVRRLLVAACGGADAGDGSGRAGFAA